jgi:uncharacterized membrane protein YhaH (DUF805 family)
MDWGKLFLSAEGRIGQKDFWIGVLILIVAWVVSHLAHIFAPLIWLLLIYPWVCVYAKRLHDFDKSGWMMLIPVVVGFLALIGAIVVGGVAAIGAIFTASTDSGADAGNWMAVLGALGVALAFLCIAAIVKLIFLLWVGLSRGDPGPNRYGPPQGVVETAPPAPPATV